MKLRTRDVAVASMAAAIFAITMIFVAPFTIVPGAIIFYIPSAWQLLWPIWFGIPGSFGILIGNFIGSQFKGLYGPAAFIEAIGNCLSGLIPYYMIRKGTSDLKSIRDYILLFMFFLPGKAIGTLITTSGYALFGIMSWQTAIFFVYPSYMIFDLIWQFTFGVLLLKTITPRLKQIGIYYGVYAEDKSKKSVCAPLDDRQV